MDILFYHASGEEKTGLVGFLPDSTQASSLTLPLENLPLSSGLVTPALGDGYLSVYSKHYVNITGFDGNTGARDVTVSVLAATKPDQIFLASALTHEEGITGSHHLGVQTGLPWTHAEPSFIKGQGWGNGVLLTNGSGDLGSPVGVDTSTANSMGFWIERRYSENYEFAGPTGTGFIQLGFAANPA